MSLDEELVSQRAEFLQELLLDCDDIETLILNLLKSTNPHLIFNSLLRKIHSIKGVAGSYELPLISNVCHNFEDILKEMDLQEKSPDLTVDALLAHKDQLFEVVICYREGQEEKLKKIEELYFLSHAPKKLVKNNVIQPGVIKIFVIESSEIVTKIVANTFKNEKVQLSFAKDGYEALGRLLRQKFDLVISNMHVATINGMSIVNTLRLSEGVNANTPFVIVSTKTPNDKKYPFMPDIWISKDKQFSEKLIKFYQKQFQIKTSKNQEDVFEYNLKEILLIDDSLDIHAFVQTAVKKNPGTILTTAFNSTEAIAKLPKIKPDVILLDNFLANESGTDVFKKLRAEAQSKDIPIIFLTGYSKDEEKIALLNLGAIEVLRKPFSITTLIPKIKECLYHYSRRQSKDAA